MVRYFSLDFNDIQKQSTRKTLRSLLSQLPLQCKNILQDLEKSYQNCGEGQQQPLETTIRSLFSEVLSRPGQKFIFLDTLDECTDREEFLTFVRELMKLKPLGLHILTTSRRERDVKEELSSVADFIIINI